MCSLAYASGVRTIDADAITSPDKTKTFTFPSVSTALQGVSDTATLSNKTISGLSNTLTQVPIAINQQQETPSGAINSINVTYSLAFSPVTSGSVVIFLDGLLQSQGSGLDYTMSSSTITFTTAPVSGQTLMAIYPRY